jgi:cysteine-rich repeat protein
MRIAPLLLLLACNGPDDPDDPTLPAGCGDGQLDPDEACDDGPDNSDTTADACRTTCALPRCGDGTVDSTEQCDDGGLISADGCSFTCTTEQGPFETEPNDLPFDATPVLPGESTLGALGELDLDCFAIDSVDNGFLSALATGPDATCNADLVLRAYAPDDELLTYAYPAEDGCTRLDPTTEDDLKYLQEGTYTVCVEGLFRAAVPAYRLTVESGDDSCLSVGGPPDPEVDLDLDGLADPCDSDDDQDGVPDLSDNCPRVPNGPSGGAFTTWDSGYLRTWLLLGPVTGRTYPSLCEPSAHLLAEDDATVYPELGDSALGLGWRAMLGTPRTLNFLTWFSSGTPREVYAVSWVYSPETRTGSLKLGHDDGARAWLNDTLLGTDPTCHGVTTDAFTYPITLNAGWNRLMVKVRDNGGGWGLVARFVDTLNVPMTDLELSPGGPYTWVDNQGDGDGDGTGDACDADPANPAIR